MYHPTFNILDILKNYRLTQIKFNIVQVGAGGNGGYLVQRLSKLLFAITAKEHLNFTYKIIDGDIVEKSNLLRQPFIEEDLHMPKAQTLAERYDNAYGIPILYSNTYAESVEELLSFIAFQSEYMNYTIPVILGCVDNNASRKVMHETFQKLESCIYIDSGIDSVNEDKDIDSGYSGQVVCGIKLGGKVYLEPVGIVYSNILEDVDSRLPTQACGEQVVYYPQRMQTNEVAALVMTSYLNTLLSEGIVTSHYTNFNARTMMIRPTYLQKEDVLI